MKHRRQLSAVILFASFLVARLHEPALGEAIQLHRVPICSKTLKSCSWSAKITGTIDDGTVNKLNVLAAYQRMLQDIRSYFREMNVSEQLADAILRVAPKNIRFLDYDALRLYGLTAVDPVEQETLDLQEAQSFQLDRQEYMKRKALSERVCPRDRNELLEVECRFAIMEGRKPDIPDFSRFGIPVQPQR